ncbi:MAG: hypothetical protein CMJ36_05705 [Phycisphaerae bacterium]|nr:hypothetical protein [Phycisphaerae bacterium]
MSDWSIPGSSGRPIIGTTHSPSEPAEIHVLLAHGFKGYKDYGFIPWLAEHLADAGHVVHRFNFSHGGMDHGHGSFDESAFQEDTWNRQVEDLLLLFQASREGSLPGGTPGGLLLAGHSRGGVSSLLAAGRHAGEGVLDQLRGIATLASPAACLHMSDQDRERLLDEGRLASPSSRTGQVLHVGRSWLSEQLEAPQDHDLLAIAAKVKVPVHVIHGTEDDAVPVECAHAIGDAVDDLAGRVLIEGANHVFNTPNPFPVDGDASPSLRQLGEVLARAAGAC